MCSIRKDTNVNSGICTSTGIIHDFSGSYSVSVDNMEFGDPMKYWQLDKNKLPLSISDKV
ncbi:hypothetical protein PFMALIP_00966 [Plasmodium falciparum MaliPS096_E11]|uniref:Uncharacterized protein n=1 Tax=Plasmodium falciparum MaliPS096_E11 TaxID=1036727 RepID=A0A024WVP5_PLAFA|nr:hypothetical protein PFMALIP_00966 [Plasmodium falciparum MaliPS096_E11]